mgnify:CR=1 FL=1
MGGFFLCQWGRRKWLCRRGGVQIYETIQGNRWKSETGRLLAAYHSSASVYHNRIYKRTEGYHCFKSR